MSTALFDAPGPITRRRIVLGSVLGSLVVVGLAVFVVWQLAQNGQLAASKWEPLSTSKVWAFLAKGLGFTLAAAAVALLLALALGILLAIGRMSVHRWIAAACTTIVEVLRGAPVLLLMLFFFLAFPILFDLDLPAFWGVVLALTLFNGAVICEIVRAGVASLPRGQREGAAAIGMRHPQILQYILLPQAFRVMLPTLISQIVVLLKDTSLGFVIGYQELLQRSQVVQQLYNNPLQTFVVVAVVYIVLNSAVSAVSQQVGNRQKRQPGREAPTEDTDVKATELELESQ